MAIVWLLRIHVLVWLLQMHVLSPTDCVQVYASVCEGTRLLAHDS